jgi:thiamine kinase-like enzyme
VPAGEVLQGGVANAGAVVRHGDEVVRPSNEHSKTIHALLRHVRSQGFTGVPEPRRLGSDGREWLSYIPGDVPVPPFPEWSESDAALASTATLLRKFHDATAAFDPLEGATWSTDLSDPEGGEVICHNDVCAENVVYRHGVAVALLDFDFAAPGRRIFDLAAFASMCVPLDTPQDAERRWRAGLDPFTRLRVIADAYGLPPGRSELIHLITERFAGGGAFVQRQVEAGIPAFVQMWNEMGGQERYERRRRWFESQREHFVDAVG